MDSMENLTGRMAAFVASGAPSLASRSAVLAVSGGADSVATAALVCEAGIVDSQSSAVAHFDHRLRGPDESAADLGAVRALCDRYGLRLEVGVWADPRSAEAAAREARYAFLTETARRLDVNVIATGHTADDQAETVLMHAMRGAGLHGLRGMGVESPLPVQSPNSITLTRPALCLSRAETRAYCAANNLQFTDDPSNSDRRYLRNRIRLDMLGRSAHKEQMRATLLRLADDAARVVAAAESVAGAAILQRRATEVVLSRAALQAMLPEMRPYAFRLAAEHVLGDVRDIERRHYEVLSATCDARTGASFELPRGLVVTVDRREIVLSLGTPSARVITEGFAARIPFAGEVGDWRLHVVPVHEGAVGGHPMPPEAVVRRRRPGDRVRLAGGSRKLQDVLVDAHVPRRLRDGMPLIALGEEVLWTPIAAAVAPRASVGWRMYRIESARLDNQDSPRT
jgi:tRNA(Ile)-lysidine synthase